MPKSKIIIALGAVIALLPFLGFPHAWESFFEVVAGLSIVGLSVWGTIDKKLTLKAKAEKRQMRKSQISPQETVEEATARLDRRTTDFYPKTGQPGRRATDLGLGVRGESREENNI